MPPEVADEVHVEAAIRRWNPASLLCMDKLEPESQFALLILNQPIENLNLLRLVWKKAFFRIAADGGANRLADAFRDLKLEDEKIGLEVICGDLDSLLDQVRENAIQRGTKVIKDPDQYSTDLQKCIAFLRENVLSSHRHTTSNIVCLGGLGGRVDQALSQLHQLYAEQQKDPDYLHGRVYLLSTEGLTFVLQKGTHRIRVNDPRNPVLGRHIGIIPLKEPSTITTKGLEWDVTNWRTEFGGQISTSNLVREDVVDVMTTGDVLFTIDLDVPPSAGNDCAE